MTHPPRSSVSSSARRWRVSLSLTLLAAAALVTPIACGVDATHSRTHPTAPEAVSAPIDARPSVAASAAPSPVTTWDVYQMPRAAYYLNPARQITGMPTSDVPQYSADLTANGALDGTIGFAVYDASGGIIYDDATNPRHASWSSTNTAVADVSRNIPTQAQGVFFAKVSVKAGGQTSIKLTMDDGSGANPRTVAVQLTVSDKRPVTITKITISPASATLQVGASQRFKVVAYDANNTAYTPTQQVAFTTNSTNISLQATSGTLDQADVTALAGGTATVTATAYAQTATATITIPGMPATLTATSSAGSGIVSSCTAINVTRKDAGGLTTTQGGPVQWSSSLPGAVTVTAGSGDAANACPGTALGTAQITATVNGTNGPVSVSIPITHYNVLSISISPTSLSLVGLASGTLSATVTADGGAGSVTLDPSLGSGVALSWTSADPAIAKVTSAAPRSATITAQGATGSTTIAATLGSVTSSVPVSVTASLSAALSGPDYVTTPGLYTWQAFNVTGGIAPYSYYWEWSSTGGSSWTQLLDPRYRYPYPSSTTTIQHQVDCASPSSVYVRVRVTSSDGQVVYASRHFSNSTSAPYGQPCSGTGQW